MENAPGGFSGKANDLIEWRGIEKNGEFKPYAIIYRVDGYDENTQRTKTRLLVFALNNGKADYLGFAEGENEDAKAKAIADSARRQPPG